MSRPSFGPTAETRQKAKRERARERERQREKKGHGHAGSDKAEGEKRQSERGRLDRHVYIKVVEITAAAKELNWHRRSR